MDQANQMREANAAALELTATLPVKSLPLGDSGVDVGLFTPPFAQARSWALRLYRYREELAARDDDHVRDDDDATQFDLIVEAVGLCTGASHDGSPRLDRAHRRHGRAAGAGGGGAVLRHQPGGGPYLTAAYAGLTIEQALALPPVDRAGYRLAWQIEHLSTPLLLLRLEALLARLTGTPDRWPRWEQTLPFLADYLADKPSDPRRSPAEPSLADRLKAAARLGGLEG